MTLGSKYLKKKAGAVQILLTVPTKTNNVVVCPLFPVFFWPCVIFQNVWVNF